jgi:signal transduction histidine kinase
MLKADPSFPTVETALVPCEVEADAGQVKQLMINLLRNAATAIRATKGTIRVATRLDEEAVISVWDSAGSIREDDVERIFEPFFSRSAGGTGLGLSTVRTIVHGHGGHVELRSTPAEGTTFSVSLPKAR